MGDWLDDAEKKRLERSKDFSIDVISTSYLDLDNALGGGLPYGKIIELSGQKGSCKSAIIQDMMAQAQAKELGVVYLDADRKFDAKFAHARGVRIQELLIFQPDPLQPDKTIEAIKLLVETNQIQFIVIDSISMYGDGCDDILRSISKLITTYKIIILITSQIRNNFEHPRDYRTPYMKILNEYCNIRMNLKQVESIKANHVLIGKRIEVDVYKNVITHPKSFQMEVYF